MGYASDSSTSSYRILDDEDMKIKVSRDTILPKKQDIVQSKMSARGSIQVLEEWDNKDNKSKSVLTQDPLGEIPDKIIPAPMEMNPQDEAQPDEAPTPEHQSPMELLRRLARHDKETNSDVSSIDPLALTNNPETWGSIAQALNAMANDTPNNYREAIQFFYVRCCEGELLMLSVHVDDQLIACNSRKTLDEFKQKLNSKFECSDSGPAGYFLGVNIYRDRAQKKLYLSQEHYMESLLECFDMTSCNPAKTPLPSATVTRPDLAHAASVLSRFISKWNESHWLAAKHCLRYIRGTSDLSLVFDAHSSKQVALGYVDADWGGDLDTRRSTTGYVFKVYGGVVAWKSKRQPTVALLTTEAEYMASADAAKQAIWLRLLLEDIGLGLGDQPFQLVNDNAGAIALSKNPKIEDKTVSLAHVPSVENIADLLTKSLPAEAFVKLCQLLGMKRLDQGGVLE
ncbi:hypothetical protein D1P53_001698 [Cryptococcus gattii VGV]|nr:hypothetical protein D1P53_001698 [Cryptococcus gattii VGV]